MSHKDLAFPAESKDHRIQEDWHHFGSSLHLHPINANFNFYLPYSCIIVDFSRGLLPDSAENAVTVNIGM